MTMILTCLTKDYTVQASDRRLTRTVNRKVEVVEDQSNKALIYNNRLAFAYTGRAKLILETAIDWAANRLSEKESMEEAIYHLRDRATDLMKNFYSSDRAAEKMLAFVGAGFAEMKENGRWELKPCRIVISNFRERNGTWLNTSLKEFRVDIDSLSVRSTFELFVAGRQLSKERLHALNNLIKWCLRNKKGPETIGRLLAREIQKVSEKDEYVGKNIMCTFVPRELSEDGNVRYHFGGVLMEKPVTSTEPQQIAPVKLISIHDRFTIIPPFDDPRFIYVAEDNSAFPYKGPVYVVPGKVVPEMNISEINITTPPFIRVSDTTIG